MRAGEAWLRDRLQGAPEPLLRTMIDALPTAAGGDAEAFAAAAARLYEGVLRGSGGRPDALPLLAADALVTHAFEARAGGDIDDLAAFAERVSGSLADLHPAP